MERDWENTFNEWAKPPGKTEEQRQGLLADALALAEAGACAIVLELVRVDITSPRMSQVARLKE